MFWPNLEKIDSSIILYYALYKISPFFEMIVNYFYSYVRQNIISSYRRKTYIPNDTECFLKFLFGEKIYKYKLPGCYIIYYNKHIHILEHKNVELPSNFYTEICLTSCFYNYEQMDAEYLDFYKRQGKKDDSKYIYVSHNNNINFDSYGILLYWGMKVDKIQKRNWHNTIIEEPIKVILNKKIDEFINEDPIYEKYQIPRKLCMLFYGRPGMGKSSIIKTLASELNYNLITISLSKFTDFTLPFLYKSIPPDSLIVFEDIDCAFTTRESEPNPSGNISTKVTLSGFLNTLDGISSNNKVITILTTNYIDKLDEALIRQERVDLRIHLEPSPYLYGKMYDRFFENPEFRSKYVSHCIAKNYCLADAQHFSIQILKGIISF